MGIAERKERQRAELREQILSAAREIVLSRGFAELSMRKIAEAIEYSPATIYLYFQNRDEIALQLVREAFTQLLDYFAVAATCPDPLERLTMIGRQYVRFGLEAPEAYRLIFMEDPRFAQSVLGREKRDDPDEPGGRAYGVLIDTVRELIESGRFKPVAPEDVANVVWASLHGIVSLHITCPQMGFDDVPRLADVMNESLLRGLLAHVE